MFFGRHAEGLRRAILGGPYQAAAGGRSEDERRESLLAEGRQRGGAATGGAGAAKRALPPSATTLAPGLLPAALAVLRSPLACGGAYRGGFRATSCRWVGCQDR